MTRILIVEDQSLLCELLKELIGGQEDMEVIGTTDDAALAPALCHELKPDLVLMDVITKNNSNGITYSAQIRRELPEIKIVVMTGLPEISFADEARKAGVHSFINKDRGKEHLFFAIRDTMQGHGIYPGPEANAPFNAQFTERELAVVRLVCQGKSRSEIAKELAISESVAKKIISGILDKTYFDSVMKFAVYAVSRGLIVTESTGGGGLIHQNPLKLRVLIVTNTVRGLHFYWGNLYNDIFGIKRKSDILYVTSSNPVLIDVAAISASFICKLCLLNIKYFSFI